MDVRDWEARADELKQEVAKATKALDEGRLESKRYVGIVNKASDEMNAIANVLKNFKLGRQIEARQEAEMGGPAFSGVEPAGTQAKGLPSIWDLTDDQWGQMKWAMESRVPCRIEVKSGPGKRAWHSRVQAKSAFSTTSSMSGRPYSGNIPAAGHAVGCCDRVRTRSRS